MRALINWINSYGPKKKIAGIWVIMTICYVLIAIGLFADGVGLGEFISRENAGLAGQIAFWAFAALYAYCLSVIFFAKRTR
jgi:FtsH-binding integral membrane protein